MTVATRLHCDLRDRRGGEVMRHDRRGSPVEGKRRLRHPTHSDRYQFPNPCTVLAFEDLHRITVEVQSRTKSRTVCVRAQSLALFAELLQRNCIHRSNTSCPCEVL